MIDPTISVIIPLYNHENYIKDAIDSVVNQTFEDFELIIINDGSTDKSENVVKEIHDHRIKYYFQENQGASNTINKGIKFAKGEYISILNSDDKYDHNRLNELFNILEEENEIAAAFSDIEIIDDKGDLVRYHKGAEENWVDHDPASSFKGEEKIILDLLAGNFLLTTSNLFCRKTIFSDIGYFSQLRYAHDYDFFLRLCYHFRVHIESKALLKYRQHPKNTIKESEAETNFETGLVLSDFLMKYDISEYFPDHNIYLNMQKFFNSINSHDSERMMMTLFLFELKYTGVQELIREFDEKSEDPFKIDCVKRFKTYLTKWQVSQEANEWWLNKWTETKERLDRAEHKLTKMDENLLQNKKEFVQENETLINNKNKVKSIQRSAINRWKRLIAWPFRAIK
jgi:glycosyltransferase involved in cell wall biosynthesis